MAQRDALPVFLPSSFNPVSPRALSKYVANVEKDPLPAFEHQVCHLFGNFYFDV